MLAVKKQWFLTNLILGFWVLSGWKQYSIKLKSNENRNWIHCRVRKSYFYSFTSLLALTPAYTEVSCDQWWANRVLPQLRCDQIKQHKNSYNMALPMTFRLVLLGSPWDGVASMTGTSFSAGSNSESFNVDVTQRVAFELQSLSAVGTAFFLFLRPWFPNLEIEDRIRIPFFRSPHSSGSSSFLTPVSSSVFFWRRRSGRRRRRH